MQSDFQNYTVGFAFAPDLKSVLLILKNRPKWQAGKLNGVGGKFEEGETEHQCMVREFKEETSISTEESDWQLIGTHSDVHTYKLFIFATKLRVELMDSLLSTTDELVQWHSIRVAPHLLVNGVDWYIYMCLNSLGRPLFTQTVEGP